MELVARLDRKGRLLLPRELREAAGLEEGSRLLVRLRGDGVIELVPLDRLRRRVEETWKRRMRGWREENHEAARLLEQLAARGDS